MANHGYVRTKKPMTKADLLAIIDELNTSHFHGKLTVEADNTKYIEIFYKGEYCRQFWLNNKKSFEISHRGTGDIGWWVGAVVTHTIAKRFDGVITDDGYDGKEQPEPEKYPTYERFLEMLHGTNWKTKLPAALVKHILSEE